MLVDATEMQWMTEAEMEMPGLSPPIKVGDELGALFGLRSDNNA